jgi:hypothetical protein
MPRSREFPAARYAALVARLYVLRLRVMQNVRLHSPAIIFFHGKPYSTQTVDWSEFTQVLDISNFVRGLGESRESGTKTVTLSDAKRPTSHDARYGPSRNFVRPSWSAKVGQAFEPDSDASSVVLVIPKP